MTDRVERTPLQQILGELRAEDGLYHVNITSDWQQGRAVYGGLSTALCLATARRAFSDLPPLRSALVRFIGPPTSASLDFTTRKVRQGRSATFIDVEASSEGAPVVHVSFVFGAARTSAFSKQWRSGPDVAAPEACPPLFEQGGAPNFTQHFESRFATGQIPISGAETGDLAVWLRHKDEAHRQSIEGLVCLADGLPPAAMTMMSDFSPVSSMTWMFDIVGDSTATDEGWWLCRSTQESVGEGYSSQRMAIWNTQGQPVLLGRQNCAIFA